MRKFGIWLLIALLGLGMGLPARAEVPPLYLTATQAEISDSDPFYDSELDIARAVWDEAGIAVYEQDPERFITGTYIIVEADGQREKAVCVALRANDGAETCYAVTVLLSSGEVALVDAFVPGERYAELQEAKGSALFWSLEDAALYHHLFMHFTDDVTCPAVPEEGDMPREEAVRRVKEIIAEGSGATEADLQALLMTAFFSEPWNTEPDNPYNTRYWSVCFVQPLHGTGGRYEEQYAVNISSPDGSVLMYYDLSEDGPANG